MKPPHRCHRETTAYFYHFFILGCNLHEQHLKVVRPMCVQHQNTGYRPPEEGR